MSRNVDLGMFDRYDSLREGLLVLKAWAIFCWFLFFDGIKTLIWYKFYVLRTINIEKV